ncbi:hypothetical protein [Microcoleus sp. K4-C2]|uniref:hypothetical protein n=1 Tax=Microcoleus sp. K4-C2 TaxID=2818792 RepID=UPI002FD12A90
MPDFLFVFSPYKNPCFADPIFGAGCVGHAKSCDRQAYRIDLIAFWQNVSLQYSLECYFFYSQALESMQARNSHYLPT